MTTETQKHSLALPLGLSFATCSTMLLEITLTRIFSVTMWYHYAFMAICIALFGMAFGAVLVYLRPKWFPQEKIYSVLSVLSIVYGVSIFVSFWIYLLVPFSPNLTFWGILSVLASFALVSIPFLISGILVCLVLTRFPASVGKLYAFDLVGAAIGCLILWALIGPLTGPGMVLFAGTLAFISAVLFSIPSFSKKLVVISGVLLFVFFTMSLIQPHYRILEIRWVKNTVGIPQAEKIIEEPIVERWNSHSVITVFKNIYTGTFGWGLSPKYKEKKKPQQLMLVIDGAAGTIITKYSGKANQIEHFTYDVTSLAHHVKPESDVLIIGTGGGKDILTSLLFNPKSVTGVEINKEILELINDDMGSFTGHIDQNEKVKFVNDEARSWVERTDKKFGIIQASLIDSWAATSAGAFVLTENSLYTVEAWTEFLNHLTDDGVLTMSRWWMRDRPGEMIRLTSLAYEALIKIGAKNPRDHILLATTDRGNEDDSPNGVGTIIVSKTPLTQQTINTFKHTCKWMEFQVLLTPQEQEIEIFSKLLDPATNAETVANYPLNVYAPTDDDPFFFNMLRFSNILNLEQHIQWMTSFNMTAIATLVALLVVVILLSLLVLLLPIVLHERKLVKSGMEALSKRSVRLFSLYFASIGLGFILVEMGLIQRLTLFLGHPVHSLTVVLFSLLTATGIGSSLTGKFVLQQGNVHKKALIMLTSILVVSLLLAVLLPNIFSIMHGSPLMPRIVFSIVILVALGMFLGSAFPIGLHFADQEIRRATPWLWAINGALSVIGSVLSVIISISQGISFTCIIGSLCYVFAIISLILIGKTRSNA